ncbi:Hypothetical protein CINCED_3A017974 [Cinara cedri]|uniref:Uncharacterized protein n=1 Tax=Cinara cedri TaxID=506608 RepID=A0A5E4M2Q2_9HEMI|nr:Hypothetical protein CINCED_3A017974 [Cinara cedri]
MSEFCEKRALRTFSKNLSARTLCGKETGHEHANERPALTNSLALRKYLNCPVLVQHVFTHACWLKKNSLDSYYLSTFTLIKIQQSITKVLKPDFVKQFKTNLCNAFVAANIPLHELGNHVLKSFLEKHTGKSIPDENTIRKDCIPNIYKSIMDQIINDIGNNYVYIIVDETTNPRDGTPSKSYLIACKELEFTNYVTICQFIDSSLKIFPGNEQKA